jgi:hypothetical protein
MKAWNGYKELRGGKFGVGEYLRKICVVHLYQEVVGPKVCINWL